MNNQLPLSITEWLPHYSKIEKARWTKHVQQIYEVLIDKQWHNKQELMDATGTGNFQARIHDLRKSGFLVECLRKNKEGLTMYRIVDYVGYDTTTPKHCNCCRYNEDYVPGYTG
tara:strand:+ start:2499 stop:2840 length:342 start_codon:yes stop_codon:yes gene_type:complete